MNAPEKLAFLVDVQARADDRDLCIDAVGIKGVRQPITIRAGTRPLPTVATLRMGSGPISSSALRWGR
jgi:GTP cyclohydrolase I